MKQMKKIAEFCVNLMMIIMAVALVSVVIAFVAILIYQLCVLGPSGMMAAILA